MKAPGFDRLGDIRPQHEVRFIGLRKDHTLVSGQPARVAGPEKAFDLVMQAAYHLRLAQLVHRPGNRQILAQRDVAQRREDGADLGERGGIGASLRYFSLGEITFRNEQGEEQGTYRPYEMSLDVAYALQLSDHFSGGVSLRYALSDLAQGQVVGGQLTKVGQTVATDVSMFYQGDEFSMPDGQRGQWVGGLTLSNIGAKIRYSESGAADFIPTNMRGGAGFNWTLDKYNRVSFLTDVNKLLVPTQPTRDLLDADNDGDRSEIIAGKDDNVGTIQGIIQSWDPSAKPDGFKELMREFMVNVGTEYWYNEQFAVRAGYQHEDVTKGNRRFFTMGFGIRYNLIGLDFAYLFPADQTVRSPLENTIRFSALVDLNQIMK